MRAVGVAVLPKGSVSFEMVAEARSRAVVSDLKLGKDGLPTAGSVRHVLSAPAANPAAGGSTEEEAAATAQEAVTHVPFSSADLAEPRQLVAKGQSVEYALATNKATGELRARDVTVLPTDGVVERLLETCAPGPRPPRPPRLSHAGALCPVLGQLACAGTAVMCWDSCHVLGQLSWVGTAVGVAPRVRSAARCPALTRARRLDARQARLRQVRGAAPGADGPRDSLRAVGRGEGRPGAPAASALVGATLLSVTAVGKRALSHARGNCSRGATCSSCSS